MAFVLVLTTAGDDAGAERLARALVDERLAACVNVVPGVVSTYRWRGEVRKDAERLLIVKTRAELWERVRARILALHAYEQPEVLRVDVADGDRGYLAWLAAETEGA